MRPLRSYLQLTRLHKRHILPYIKVSVAKDHGKNCLKVGLVLFCYLLCNGLLTKRYSNLLPYFLAKALKVALFEMSALHKALIMEKARGRSIKTIQEFRPRVYKRGNLKYGEV